MRAALDDLQALDIDDFLAALRVILVDVPGVPVARLVLGIGPELIAAPRQRLAPARLVDETFRSAPSAPTRRAEIRVFEMSCARRSSPAKAATARDP